MRRSRKDMRCHTHIALYFTSYSRLANNTHYREHKPEIISHRADSCCKLTRLQRGRLLFVLLLFYQATHTEFVSIWAVRHTRRMEINLQRGALSLPLTRTKSVKRRSNVPISWYTIVPRLEARIQIKQSNVSREGKSWEEESSASGNNRVSWLIINELKNTYCVRLLKTPHFTFTVR